MTLTRIEFSQEHRQEWAGMGDFLLVSPNGNHEIQLPYVGEPPWGDSYHTIQIDGHDIPGLAWGCAFAMSSCSRYLAFSWMRQRIERKTMVVDMEERRYTILPNYIFVLEIEWPYILGEWEGRKGKDYEFNGAESWFPYAESS